MNDERFMAAALALGRRNLGLTAPNPSVGALIVREGRVLGAGATGPGGRPHAETQALAEAGEAARGATAYVTLEPCSHHGQTPPCAEALIAAGVARVVCALADPDARVAGRGFALLRAADIGVVVGPGAAAAARDHRGHVLRVTQGRPCVTLKIARTADGFAAGDAHDARLAITGEIANRRTQTFRSLHDAIMVGIGTALGDDPLLTVRQNGLNQKPLRVVLDRRLQLPPGSRLAATAGATPTLVLAGADASTEVEAVLRARGVEVERVGEGFDLDEALRALGRRGITRVFSEGGPTVGAALIAADLADEVLLFTAEKPLGRAGRPALAASALAALEGERYAEAEAVAYGPDTLRRWERRLG
jgi:diaminohydroxyphosphoribosylaminopyrimidine deaminase/5-amino-6-(5-phosphoribosylamino)uracil reductase